MKHRKKSFSYTVDEFDSLDFDIDQMMDEFDEEDEELLRHSIPSVQHLFFSNVENKDILIDLYTNFDKAEYDALIARFNTNVNRPLNEQILIFSIYLKHFDKLTSEQQAEYLILFTSKVTQAELLSIQSAISNNNINAYLTSNDKSLLHLLKLINITLYYPAGDEKQLLINKIISIGTEILDEYLNIHSDGRLKHNSKKYKIKKSNKKKHKSQKKKSVSKYRKRIKSSSRKRYL